PVAQFTCGIAQARGVRRPGLGCCRGRAPVRADGAVAGLPLMVSCLLPAGYDPVMGAGARGGAAGAGGGGLVGGLRGAVEVASAAGGLAGVARPMLRVLVAMLGVAPGRVVPDEALVDGLWGEEWSRERERNLHTHVSALRRLLAAGEPGRDGGRGVRAGGGDRLVAGEGGGGGGLV